MAHSGPSRACASFALTMSVHIFGHFEQFSTFAAKPYEGQARQVGGHMYSCLAELRKPSYHILLNPLFILSVYVMMWRTANV